MALQVGTPQSRAPRAKAKQPGQFERFSGWLTLAANLGVLGGLVLVLLQLNQNEKMMRAQTRHEIASATVQLLSNSAANQQLAEVITRNNEGGELTPVETYQLQLRVGALLRLWEDAHYQYRMGLYDEEEFSRERRNWKAVIGSNKGFLSVWCRTRDIYSTEFANDMNRLIGAQACEPAQT